MTQLPDICRGKHGGHPQSEAANRALHPRKQRLRDRILDYVRSCGARGTTRDEIVTALDIPLATVSGRCAELKFEGLLLENGQTRRTRYDHAASVLVAIGTVARLPAAAPAGFQGQLWQSVESS